MLYEKELSRKVIGAAIEVHRALGPGLLESAYVACLTHELRLQGIPVECEKPFKVEYKGLTLNCAYRIDILVDGKLIVEAKAVNEILPVHEAQLLTYLRLTGCKVGLLLNFNVPVLKDGIKRFAK